MERSIKADFALLKAYKADTKGNLIFNKTARNFNQDMAGSGKITVAEVEEIVEAGELNPDEIHVSGVHVHRVFKGTGWEKPIEKLVFARNEQSDNKEKSRGQVIREKIAKRACREISDGMYINLGIGIPTLIPAYLDPAIQIELHSENGVMGVGNYPVEGKQDPDLINAGKVTPSSFAGPNFDFTKGNHLYQARLLLLF